MALKSQVANFLLGLPLYAKLPDKRGWAWGMNLTWISPTFKFKQVFTLPRKVRGGEIHPHQKLFVITAGEVELLTWEVGLDGPITRTTVKASRTGHMIEPNTPHIFVFHKAATLVEWWPGPYRVIFPETLRKHVEEGYNAVCGAYP